MDWAKLIAASGMIAVSAQAGTAPETNSYHVLEFLAANADLLGIDLTRIGFWACSGQGGPVFKALQNTELPYRDGFRAAVFLYLDLRAAVPSAWPKSLSVFVVRAGSDQNIRAEIVYDFISRAQSSKVPTEYIELAGAPHAFDILQNTQESKDVIRQALEFFKGKLLQ
jgi:dienelactone hydrolase